MFGSIILRDIPKQEVRCDRLTLGIEGGFRGLAQVPPGRHYLSVLDGRYHIGFWVWLRPGEVVVKRYENGRWLDEEGATAAEYIDLAKSGAMNQHLFAYPTREFPAWFGLLTALGVDNFPPTIHSAEEGEGSRFEKAFVNTHASQPEAFLAEFQYAFVAWLVSLSSPAEDEAAFARWRHLLLAVYNAGERGITQAPELFPPLVETLMRQFACLPSSWFAADSFVMSQLNYLIEDLIDTDIPECAQKGQALRQFVQELTP